MNMWLKRTSVLLSFLSMCFLAFCYCSPNFSGGDDKMKAIIKSVRNTLSIGHYRPLEIDDNFSKDVFDSYIEALDPPKRYFLESDIEYFKKDIHNLDDFYKNEDLTFYHSTVDTVQKRILEAKAYTEEILKNPFDFSIEEDLIIGDKATSYAKNKKEAKDLWRKYLKYNTMLEIIRIQEDSTNLNKSFSEIEIEARNEVKDITSDFFRRMTQREKNKYLTLYINSFTERYDPHTNYFSPKEKDDFDVNMSGQLEGIGAKLQDKKGYATIIELVVGGPAWKDGQLEVGDQITKVAEGRKEAVNIVGMALDDAIRYIRGKKGTKVTLTVKKKDGSYKDITLVRDVVEQEEVFARSAIVSDANGDKYGIVYLPEFYKNLNDRNGRDPSDDITKEINELKKENIKGLIFDLRYNGGGSLSEVVEISGLFIGEGPILQVKRSDGKISLHESKNSSILYDGPLVVLVNELSASASEIFAAAMQDYERAVVIGGEKTFGKGTVQAFLPIDRFTYSTDELGALKLTIQKFYRVNGGSTQLKGVTPDVIIPSPLAYAEISEEARKNALPWDQIGALSYKKWKSKLNLKKIKQSSNARLTNNEHTKLMESSAKYYKIIDDLETIPLNLEQYKTQRKEREDYAKKFEALENYDNNLKISSPIYEKEITRQDTVLKAKRESWHKNLTKDFYLEESINVLKDIP